MAKLDVGWRPNLIFQMIFELSPGATMTGRTGTAVDILAVVRAGGAIAAAVGFQVVKPSVPRTLTAVINGAPPGLREQIEPGVEFWRTALLDIFDLPEPGPAAIGSRPSPGGSQFLCQTVVLLAG